MKLRTAIWLSWCALATANMVQLRHTSINKRQSSIPNQKRFIRRAEMAVAAIDNYLYISGGDISQYLHDDGTDYYKAPVNQTLSLPLNKSWDVDNVEYVTTHNEPIYPQVAGHSLVVGASRGRERLWSWGGRTDLQSRDPRLYVLTPNGKGGGEWSEERVPNSITRGEFGAGTACDGYMVYFGGRLRRRTDERAGLTEHEESIALPGVLHYDFTNGTWKNHTSEGWPVQQETYLRGELLCARPEGTDPVVFAIGGGTIPATDAKDSASQMLDMSTILFWDMAAEKWFKQSTSGDETPDGRLSFCAVGAASKNSTYEIFVYGGWDKDGKGLDDIWILSLPAFRWFKADANSTTRFDHKCHRSGDQMISIGGNVFDDLWEEKDELARGIGIFNLKSLEWQTNHKADTEYDSPDMIKEWYANGGMDQMKWEGDDIKDHFVTQDGSSRSWTGGNGDRGEDDENDKDPGGDDTQDDDGDDEDAPVAAIAGGTIGGVAIIAIAGFAYWFTRRRRHKHAVIPTEKDMPDNTDTKPAQGQHMVDPYSGQYNKQHYGSPPPNSALVSELGWEAPQPVEMDGGAVVGQQHGTGRPPQEMP